MLFYVRYGTDGCEDVVEILKYKEGNNVYRNRRHAYQFR